MYSGADLGILEKGAGKGANCEAPNRAPKAQAQAGGLEKLDAISCNLAYIFGIRMASDIIQNWAVAEQKKNSSGHDFKSHRY